MRASARRVGRRFHELLEGISDIWLVTSEVAWLNVAGSETLARIISQCREWRVRVAAIFYDLIPIINEHYVGISDAHEVYVNELLRSDLILPISHSSGGVLSDFWRSRFICDLPEIFPVLLPDGGFKPRLDASLEGEKDKQAKRPFIALVGTVEPRKRQVQFLAAVAAARQASRAVAEREVVVIGSLHPAVADQFNAFVADHPWVKYLDYVDDADVALAYALADFTAFVSDDEGYGLPISESLSSGTPCLCANFGAMAEVAADGGCFTVDVRDESALQSAIITLCESADLRTELRRQIAARRLRSWGDYAADLCSAMASSSGKAAIGSMSPVELLRWRGEDFSEDWLERYLSADVIAFEDKSSRDRFIALAAASEAPGLLPMRMPLGDGMTEVMSLAEDRRGRAWAARVERRYAAGRQALRSDLKARPVFLRILISTYNRRDFVLANVRWILKRVFAASDEDVDLTVVDGASSDGTLEALRGLHDRRLTVVASPVNVGMLSGLREAGRHRGAEYLWVIGDDDFIRPEAFRAILAGLRANAGLPFAFMNFSVYHRPSWGIADKVSDVVRESVPVATSVTASGIVTVGRAAEQTDNLFTAIYAIVWRADLYAAAYDHAFEGPPFANLVEAVPCTELILRRYAGCDCLWHASPAIAGNAHNSWSRHRARWHAVVIPQAIRLARDAGVDLRLLHSWALLHRGLLQEALEIASKHHDPPLLVDAELEPARIAFRAHPHENLLL